MRAALRAVDLVQVLERELEARGERLDARAELARGERRELVEQRLDERRVDHHHRQLERKPCIPVSILIVRYRSVRGETRGDSHEGHEPGHEAVAGPLEDPEEGGEEGRREHEADCPALEHVRNEEPGRGLVEAVLLLQHEGLVDG